MPDLIRIEDHDAVRVVTMDDGRVNALSLELLQALTQALAQAGEAGRALVITGREQVFSAGFDLKTLQRGQDDAAAMLEAGARLAARLLRYPAPLVAAVNGHAMAMGAFVVLGGDLRIGVAGAGHRIAANEVAVRLTMPRFATALLRHRLTAPAFDRAAITAFPYVGEEAIAAGWLSDCVAADQLLAQSIARAGALAQLDAEAYRATKLRIRAQALAELEAGIEADVADWRRRIAA